jgi:exopolysaccharide biosynthesis polyprenyl glycosylphosphotransferase
MAVDAAVAAVAGALGLVTSVGTGSEDLRLTVAGSLPMVWVAALALNHGYERRYLGTTSHEFGSVVRSSVMILVGLSVLSYMARYQVARGVVLGVLPSLLVLGFAGRHLLRRHLRRRRLAGLDVQRTVVIGDIRTLTPMIRQIGRSPGEGLAVVAACISNPNRGMDDGSSHLEGVPVFGYPEDAMSVVDLFDAEVVAVSGDATLYGPALRRLSWDLEERNVELVLAPGLFEVAGPRLTIRPGEGMPLLHVERPVMSGARRVVKTLVDRALTVGVVVCALPVLLVVACAVRLDSPGPVLFRQKRVGERGEAFEMLKFRTMCVDAEDKLAVLAGSGDAGNAVLFKMRDDPRVTRVGRWMRRFSLDELPQLINVLRGEMSLVGPRPPLQREVDEYEPDAVRRLRVRPGLTGLWQVSGRSDLSWEESLRLDLWYVDNWSLVLDLQILFRTARAVVRGSGAY